MRALSDALPTGHRVMANPTLQLHFGCGRATPPVSHSHNWPSGRMQKFCSKLNKKVIFFTNKDPKTNFDHWMILQKHVLSFKCNDFFKMANLKAISSSATLTDVESLSPMKSRLNGCPHFLCLFLIVISQVTWRLGALYARDDNDSNYRLWIYGLYGLHGLQCPSSEKGR